MSKFFISLKKFFCDLYVEFLIVWSIFSWDIGEDSMSFPIPYNAGGNVKWYSPSGEKYDCLLKS